MRMIPALALVVLAFAGDERRLLAVLRPDDTGREADDRPTRIAVPAARVGEPLRPFVRDVWRARESLKAALRAAEEFGADVFVDLEIDDRTWLSAAA